MLPSIAHASTEQTATVHPDLTLYASLELSRATWLVTCLSPERGRYHPWRLENLASRDPGASCPPILRSAMPPWSVCRMVRSVNASQDSCRWSAAREA